jgi:hypothetical protein
MATLTIIQSGETKTLTVSTGVGAQGPPGSDATVTTEAIETALGYTPADAATNTGTNTGDQDLSGLATQSALAAETAAREAADGLKADKSNVLELDNTDAFTPTADYHPATKKYVDENAGGGPQGIQKHLTGNMSKLATKLVANPDYKARTLYIGDSLVANNIYDLGNIYSGEDGRSGAEWAATIASAGNTDNQFSRWPDGKIYNLSSSNTSLTFAASTFTPASADGVRVCYIAESGAGTFSVEVGESTSGPWTLLAASVDADNGSTAEGKVLEYQLERESKVVIRIVRLAGDTTILLNGFEISNVTGGYMFMAKSGKDLNDFILCPEAIVAPVIAAFDPDVIYFSVADDTAQITTHLENYIAKIQADLATPAGVIVSPRNPFPADTDDVDAIAQSVVLYNLAVENGWGFINWMDLLGGSGTNAAALGLVEASGVHPTEEGRIIQIRELARLWPSIFDIDKSNKFSGSIGSEYQALTRKTIAEAYIAARANIESVSLGCATLANSTNGTAIKENGMIRLTLAANATSGTAQATLRDYVISGAQGIGTRFGEKPFFRVQIMAHTRASVNARIFIGPVDIDLTSKGFGIEITEGGLNVIGHDGNTRSSEAANYDFGIVGTGVNSKFYQDHLDFLVSIDAGVISVYQLDQDPLKQSALIHRTAAIGPTTSGASSQRRLMAAIEATGVSNASVATLLILNADIGKDY